MMALMSQDPATRGDFQDFEFEPTEIRGEIAQQVCVKDTQPLQEAARQVLGTHFFAEHRRFSSAC